MKGDAMNSVEVNPSVNFVRPIFYSELGCEGLSLHQIADSLGVDFQTVKVKIQRMVDSSRITALSYKACVKISTLRGDKEINSFLLTIEEAKFFVAKWDSELGDAYTRFLIECEKKLLNIIQTSVKQPVQPVVPTNLIEALELSVKILKENEQIQLTLASKESELAISEEIIDDLSNVKDLYTRKEVVAKLRIKSLHKFCQWLRDIKAVQRVNGSDIPYATMKEKGYFVVKTVFINEKFRDNIYITSKGFAAIAKRLKEKKELEIC
jgi:phage antirepressor YoqD-like protein